MTTETVYLSAPETAVLMRRELAHAFPGVKFSVRSHVYSGGQSVDTHWHDGPCARRVRKVLENFISADFDGMQDLKTSRYKTYVQADGTFERVHYGNDFGDVGRIFDGEEDTCTRILDAAHWIAEHCVLTGPQPVEIPTASCYASLRSLDRWTFGNDYLSTLARSMTHEIDYILDRGWERAWAATTHDVLAQNNPAAWRGQGGR